METKVAFEGEDTSPVTEQGFILPSTLRAPQAGPHWGPSSVRSVPAVAEAGAPYAPFLKSERLGRISDWTTQEKPRAGARIQMGGVNAAFGYKHEEDDDSFNLIDRPKKTAASRRRWNQPGRRYAPRPILQRGGGQMGARGGAQSGRGRPGRGYAQRPGARAWGDKAPEPKEGSVDIAEEWAMVREFPFKALLNATTSLPTVETLTSCGFLDMFNSDFESYSTKQAKPLRPFPQRQRFNPPVSADPVLQRLQKEGAGTVYASDSLLALLMSADKSVFPWDMVIRKVNNSLLLDKRPQSRVDMLTVNENWQEPLSAPGLPDYNSPARLSAEATSVNHNFSQQVVSTKPEDRIQLDEKHPFADLVAEGSEPASVGYRYRRFNLSDELRVVARTEVNAYSLDKDGEPVYLSVKALNEFDSKLSGNVDWRQRLDQQTGAVLATEIKNNSCKIARWTAEAMLAGVDELKLGFVSRVNTRDPAKHTILMTKRFKPEDLARTANIKMRHMWAVLETVLAACLDMDDGKYLLVKDPNEPTMRLYSLPMNAFANESAASSR